ncbi:MAG: exodeoxyribonuclease VII large subunit [Zoogloeaceae bacterium]|nr:exodeoxyribonuclease VII large subunit [Zoogloeaceae bacterium]
MPDPDEFLPSDAPLTVAALNRLARNVLERGFPLLRVLGEVSNLARPASGHLYFTLKDEDAQVRCTMWRNRAQALPFRLDNGMRVEARASVTLYEPRGDFQLAVDGLRADGTGSLFETFLKLKQKLEAEGLFDASLKRTLPRYPRRIGVVTSPAAAAWQDVLAAFARRAPGIELVLYPAPVQGDSAPVQLAQSIDTASHRAADDGIAALLLVRGGGSLEDLWAFNDEALARAIRRCVVPVVSGIGHETDFTIADFASDLRATTPTMAAELASAGYHAAGNELDSLERTLTRQVAVRLDTAAQRLDRAEQRLVHPRERLARSGEHAGRLAQALTQALQRRIEREHARAGSLEVRLRAARPRLSEAVALRRQLAERLHAAAARITPPRHERLVWLASQLESLSPVATLARGFSITRDAQGQIVRSAAAVAPGEALSIELARGRIAARVLDVEDADPAGAGLS